MDGQLSNQAAAARLFLAKSARLADLPYSQRKASGAVYCGCLLIPNTIKDSRRIAYLNVLGVSVVRSGPLQSVDHLLRRSQK